MRRHFDHQIDGLKEKILDVGTLVEDAIANAISALTQGDGDAASAIIDGDAEIDRKEVDVEEEVLKILALYQPVAADLRFVVAILKINNGLERMGDLAKNIARRVVALSDGQRVPLPVDFRAMSDKAQGMARQSLDALMKSDANLAREVRQGEKEVKKMRRKLQTQIEELVAAHPEQTEFFMSLMSIARHLGRLAEMAANVAEEVIYMVNGEIVRHRTSAKNKAVEDSVVDDKAKA